MHVIVPCNFKMFLTVINHFLYTVPLKLNQFNTKLKLMLIFVIPSGLLTMKLEHIILKEIFQYLYILCNIFVVYF